ncbi:MAG: hypothetical protein ACKN9U_10205, partial [Pirellulaceae bacterium]
MLVLQQILQLGGPAKILGVVIVTKQDHRTDAWFPTQPHKFLHLVDRKAISKGTSGVDPPAQITLVMRAAQDRIEIEGG